MKKKTNAQRVWTSKQADAEFSKWIRKRDPRCYFCSNPSTQNSHFWPRQHSATRYDPLNCDGICGGCHMRHESKKQGLYREMKIKQIGQKEYDLMEKRHMSIVKRSEAIIRCMQLLGVI